MSAIATTAHQIIDSNLVGSSINLTEQSGVALSRFANITKKISGLFNSFVNNGAKACKGIPSLAGRVADGGMNACKKVSSLAGRVVVSFNALPLYVRLGCGLAAATTLVSCAAYFVLRPLLLMTYGKVREVYYRYQVGCASSHDPLIRLPGEVFLDENLGIEQEKNEEKKRCGLLALHYLDIYEGACRKGVFGLFSKGTLEPYVLKDGDGNYQRNPLRNLSGMISPPIEPL